ncbi:hypothetical protein EV194_101690 [Natronoflexus pectinivorans]|uniref:Uncharacterized protein n=1 Tax=Natronoflexus pectinivorans TaxID=682526 RepID=A0A4R2GS81_9BACT|nr:hypothetical protein EV194_101690 [Natronoflexus pectinivorans]
MVHESEPLFFWHFRDHPLIINPHDVIYGNEYIHRE